MNKELVVWIFQTGEPLHLDPGNNRPMRGMNLANTLAARGHRVMLWSADFDHIGKSHRGRAGDTIDVSEKLRIRLLTSPGYKRNIGFARLLDHARLALAAHQFLIRENERPDVAFIGFPPIETAYVFLRWLEANRIPALIDIKDQWPEIFIDALPAFARPAGKILFWPYFYLARRAMRSATGITTMADGFLQWALDFCGRDRGPFDAVFPLTTPTGEISGDDSKAAGEWWDRLGVVDNRAPRLYFVGSFSRSFDFLPIRDAAQLAMRNRVDIQFVLCGEGGTIDEVRAMMAGLTNVIFPGWVDRPKIEVLAGRCIASIAPYRNMPNFMLNIPNKIVDSLALGLPILSPLEGEVAKLIEAHGVGLRYDSSATRAGGELYGAIGRLINEKGLQKSMSSKARALYNSRFSFEQVYGALVDQLEQMAGQTKRA